MRSARVSVALAVVALAALPGACGTGSHGTSPPSSPDASTDSAVAADAHSDAPDSFAAPDSPAAPDAPAADQIAPDGSAPTSDAGDAGDGGAPYAWTPKPCSFYVAATGGVDTNPGTSAQPFASIAKLQAALRAAPASSKVGCLKAGTYDLSATLVLAAGKDDGETWESDPAGGVNSAVLDGGGTAGCVVHTDANDLTLDGLKLQHAVNNLTCHDDGKTTIQNLTIVNSDLGFNTAGTGSGGFPPCLMANGAKGVTIRHDYLHDCASQGIGLFAFQVGLVLDDVVIDANVVLRAVQAVPDGGAIYFQHHANYTASSIQVTDNFIRDYGTATVNNAHGIYLDEGTNHVVVRGNVIGAPTPGSGSATGCLIADGHDNVVTGNVCDLGTSAVAWAGVWWYPGDEEFKPGNSSYTGNIVVSHFAGTQKTSDFGASGPSFVEVAAPATDPTIAGNMFHNYGGGEARTDGTPRGDTAPILADPLCSGPLYTLAATSPAFSPPLSFAPIASGWGPPSFVIPVDANHSCP